MRYPRECVVFLQVQHNGYNVPRQYVLKEKICKLFLVES